MIIVTDLLRQPIDEGAKKTALNIVLQFKRNKINVFAVNSDYLTEQVDSYFQINKLLFNLKFYIALRKIDSDQLLYIPEASNTVASYIRSFLLRLFTGKKIVMMALQPRQYSKFIVFFLKLIQPQLIIVQSRQASNYLTNIGIKNTFTPLGVDLKDFRPVSNNEKLEVRKKMGMDEESLVILHVGHIKNSRNLRWLIEIKNNLPSSEVIVVGSTYSPNDSQTFIELQKANIRILNSYIPDIREIYAISDYYVFPVEKSDGAIGTPLSVLEAMASNLVVFSTRFGSLPDVIKDGDGFYFIDSVEEFMEIHRKIENIDMKKINKNSEKALEFSWEKIATRIETAMRLCL